MRFAVLGVRSVRCLLLVSLMIVSRVAYADSADAGASEAADVRPTAASEIIAEPPPAMSKQEAPATLPSKADACPASPRRCKCSCECADCRRDAYVPAPYPGCAPGYVFDGEYCVPVRYDSPTDPFDAQEEIALAARVRSRMVPKFTLDLLGGFALIDPHQQHGPVAGLTGNLLFGYRRNFQPRFGMLVRGGFMLGAIGGGGYSYTTMTGGLLEAAPYFGPFGRVYIGPSAFVGYLGFLDDSLSRVRDESRFHLASGMSFGGGVTGGVLLGDRDQTGVSASLRVDLNPHHGGSFFLMAGIGFYRPLQIPGPN